MGWAAAWACVRAGLRARAGALVVLAVVAGVSGGVVLATFAGARRADTAFERRLEAAGTPNIDISFADPQGASVLDGIGAIDGVEGATLSTFVAAAPVEGGLVPFEDTIAFAIVAETGTGAFDRLLSEGRWLSGAPDEVLLNGEMAALVGVAVGDAVTLASVSNETGQQFATEGVTELDGPPVLVTVVGILRGAEDVSDTPEPFLVVPYSYVEQNDVFSLPALVGVRTVDERADAVLADLRRLLPDAEVMPTEGFGERIVDGIDVQVVGLLALGAAVGLASLAAIVQSVGRIAGATAADDEVAGALGMRRRERRLAAMGRVAPAALGATALVVVVGALGAPLAVTGLARQADPDRGVWFDPLATVSVAVIVVIAIVGTAALSVRRSSTGGSPPPARVGPVPGVVASSAPLVASIGVRRAFGGGGPRWTARAGLLAVTAGVAVVAAVLGFTRSIEVLLDTPGQWGATFDAIVHAGLDEESQTERMAALQADSEIEAAALVEQTSVTARLPSGSEAQHPLLALEPFKGGLAELLTEGMPPIADDEAIVGPAVLEDLGLEVGDDLRVETPTGEHTLRIAGATAVYGNDRIDDGIAVTRAGAEAIGAPDDDDAILILRFAPGVDVDAKIGALTDEFDLAQPVARPGSVDNLDELGSLPLVLAAAVAGLGVFAGAVAVVIGTNRSRRELSTLRAVGAVRRQTVGTVFCHALTIAAIGVVVGLPLGIALGRSVYLAVASGIGAIARPEVPLAGIAAVGVGTLLIAMLMASVPAVRVARTGVGRACQASSEAFRRIR